MTALVSLLFIAMIPIDCNFSLHLFVYFFLETIIIFGELTAPLQKKE